MPGAVENLQGVIEAREHGEFYDVVGLQELLERWVGKRVSIIVEVLEAED